MGRELQKKKRRSGRQTVKTNNRNKKILNPRGSSVVAKNWDKKETLAQNYRRLGLLSRLKAPTGGVEKKLKGERINAEPQANPFAIDTIEKATLSEATVERDADGKIIRVISHSNNPLNDPLNELDSDNEDNEVNQHYPEWSGIIHDEADTDVVRSLVEQAQNPAPKKVRHMSEREVEWLQTLVDKYGDDTRAMAKDRKLNPMQQTAADIARRLKKFNA
ncbi:hypothetical protein VHEMI00939 [[Torrubiella] hemipterigena]|uniref:Nucleolar protein 16 n=1 Tax=[Torrubiella] hemipterigena TaxID=1531966 RepID=A0A0A1SRS8_9HYPO|nr:hypothetical protein VHEMI00939 [[Torrubiella] hemipterigena]